MEYLLEVGFYDIDLRQFLADSKYDQTISVADADAHSEKPSGNGHSSGKINGSLCVCASLSEDFSYMGRCRLIIRDMQVGKLSPLAKLVNVLKLTSPTDFAFDKMLVDSYIKYDKILVENFDLSGKSLAFNGAGSLDLKSENVDLTLTARGHRLNPDKPTLLQSITEGITHAVARMEVTGNVYDPKVTTTTLPVIKDSLGIFRRKSTTPN